MKEGGIPGLSIVIINNKNQIIRGYGFADLQTKKPVTDSTLFELASCSKAFTALAVMKLVEANQIKLDANVVDYIPWFTATYKGQVVQITVNQLLHQTSGIPWSTISLMPQSNSSDALVQAIRAINGVKLHSQPGTKYEYATVNYDILALIIERVAHTKFESYVKSHILNKLNVNYTTIGQPYNKDLMTKG